MDRLHIQSFLFIFLLWIPANALELSITNFSKYEFVKQNFSYNDGGNLKTLADAPLKPVAHLSFSKSQIENNTRSYAVTWENGISGLAPRFFGDYSEFGLSGWQEFFATERLGEFTLSFYFFPETISHEEVLFSAKPSSPLQHNSLTPDFKIVLENGYLGWKLNDFFHFGESKFSLSLKSRIPFQPGQWNHAVLGYDHQNNRLVMYLNGEMVDFVYATPNAQKNSKRYQMGFVSSTKYLNSNSPTRSARSANKDYSMMLGEYFTGLIDEIELYDKYLGALPTRYLLQTDMDKSGESISVTLSQGYVKPYRSTFASKVFRLDKNTRLTEAKIHGASVSDLRLLKLYLCSQKKYFLEQPSYSSCNQILWGRQIIDYPPAEFYQFFLVYDQLEHSTKEIQEINFTFKEDDIPLPPRWVNISQTKEGIILEWKETLDNVAGYRIYYTQGNINNSKRMIQLSIKELELYKTPQSFWTYVLEGLESDRQYSFIINSFDYRDGKVRESKPSAIKTFYNSSNFFN